MMAHIYFKPTLNRENQQSLDIQTTRVTVSDNLIPGVQALICGVRGAGNMQVFAMAEVESFWVEED